MSKGPPENVDIQDRERNWRTYQDSSQRSKTVRMEIMSFRIFGLGISDVKPCVVLLTCPLNVWLNDVEGLKPAVLSHAMGT